MPSVSGRALDGDRVREASRHVAHQVWRLVVTTVASCLRYRVTGLAAEAAFFDAQFTHRNGDHSVLAQGDDSTTGLFAFWRSLDGQRQFPRQQLVRAGLRLKEAL